MFSFKVPKRRLTAYRNRAPSAYLSLVGLIEENSLQFSFHGQILLHELPKRVGIPRKVLQDPEIRMNEGRTDSHNQPSHLHTVSTGVRSAEERAPYVERMIDRR
jgi:hypothetical protein